MAVEESRRKSGVGGRLLGRATETLKREGVRKRAPVVFANNQTGNVFGEKRGFAARKDPVYRDQNI